jgi:hypothetical protein
MRRKISPGPGLPEKEAELIDVEEAREHWNEYRLADGSTLRVKQVLTEVWRVEGEFDPDRNPLYVVRSAGIMTVVAPENLKKKVN